MNVKKLLATVVAAHVAGDKEAVAIALKKVVAEKTRTLVAEQAQANANGIVNWHDIQGFDYFGPYEVELQDGDVENVPGGLYEMCVDADVKQHGRNTEGNYSSQAADPDEYFGDRAEYEVEVHAVQLYEHGDDQAIAEIQGPAADNLVDPDMSKNIIDVTISNWERSSEDDHPGTY